MRNFSDVYAKLASMNSICDIQRFCRVLLLVTIISLMTWCQLHGRNISQEVHAIQARRYLELLDQGEYQQAWQAMTPLYRDLHLQQLWQNRNHTIRRAYGALTSRYVRQSRFRTTHKNAPDGKYVMIQFESIFEHKSKGYETVVMECTSDDKCSVVDYVIN